MQTEASNSENIEFNVTAFKGVEMGLGQDDPGVVNAERLAAQYPDHMILIQAGTFLHGYDRLPSAGFRGNIPAQARKNVSASGMSPRKSVAIFSSIGFASLGGSDRPYKTRKGKSGRRLAAVLTLLPAPRKNGSQVSARSNSMDQSIQGARTRQTQTIIPGQRFGRLTAISFAGAKKWNCRCDCGAEKSIAKRSLLVGATQSCGCLHRERTSAANGKHWACDTVTYRCWKSMRTRCTWPKSKDYPRYGGRGIKICERWMASFDNFLADMGECPGKGWTIERNDVNCNYEPSNCRWATKLEQARNTSRNRFLTHDGKTLCIGEWAQITGLTNTTITSRLNSGKTAAEALAPLTRPTPPRRNWTEQEIAEICARYAAGGISQDRLAAEYGATQWKIHMLIKSRAEQKTCLHSISSDAHCAQCDQEIEATSP